MTKTGMVLDGKYEILKEIGRGGMSVVYLAIDNRLNKQWAVKEIKNDGSKSMETLLKGLQTEANILKKVDHPVLPRIVDILNIQGTIYVVMDYIEGRTLSAILQKEGAQPQEKVIEWAKGLSSALDYLHTLDPPIIYRDMKPSNIMLKPDGSIKLIDFGTAKEYSDEDIADTTALGTRGYAAPEQFGDASGKGIYRTDARTDIYCLGATLYHIVTGMNPCEPPYEIKPIRQWDTRLSIGLEKIIMKCTQPNPEDRYQSCTELTYALEHYNELDDAYRKKEKKKLATFGVAVGMTLLFASVGIYGVIGNNKLNKANYNDMIEQGDEFRSYGNYRGAVDAYQVAIELNGKDEEAYIKLLNTYVNNLNEPDTGLEKVTRYISNGYGNTNRNNHLLFQVGLTYFDVQQAYATSLRYFRMIDEDDPEYGSYAKHYIAMAMAMGEPNTDYHQLAEDLKEFENDNAKLALSEAKLMNYKMLGIVYTRNAGNIEGFGESAVRVLNAGLDALENYRGSNAADYYYFYNLYLIPAYETYAKELEEDGKLEESRTAYFEAIAHCDKALSQITLEDNYEIYEAKLKDKAELYCELGMDSDALQVYNDAEQELGSHASIIYVSHLRYLYNKQKKRNSNVAEWNSTEILEVYDKGRMVEGIENNYEWKALVKSLQPFLSKNGR